MIYLTGESLDYKNLTCLYFYAQWSIYHEKVCKMIESFEKTSSDINFIAVDVEIYKNYVDMFEVTEIPTFVFLNEKELGRFSGIVLTRPFHSYCKKIKDKDDKRRSKAGSSSSSRKKEN